jgi:UMF1 family MFS transporter
MCFAASNVFYNAFLIDICTEDKRDKVSSYGYGAGYLSGFLMLILNLIFISNADKLGISTGTAVRICFLAAALWWGGFAAITFYLLKTRGAVKAVPPTP